MSKKIPELNLVPGGVLASNLFFEVARQISANTYNGESERIAADTLIALLTNAGAAININLISTLTPTNAAWDSARTYTPYDYLDVAYQGKHYVYSPAKQPSAGHLPTEAAYWILIASDGTVGATGPQGPAGQSITGPAGSPGAAGTPGTNGTNGISAIATTTGTPPAIPAVGSSADYAVNSTAGLIAQHTYGFGGITGTLQITAIPNAVTITLQNVDATEGATVAAGIKVAPVGKTGVAGTGGGGASGIQYGYSTTPGAGVISAADLTTATSLSINVADALGKSHSTLLGRLKIGAIIVIAKNSTNFVEYSVTSDYASGSVGVSVNTFVGSFVSGTDTVYLGIASDVVSSASGLSAGSISATPSDSQVQLTEVTPPSGSTFPPYIFQWLQNTSAVLAYPADVVAGQTANNYTATGLANVSTYYFRRVAIDQLGNKVSTPVIFASPASVAFDSDAITYFNAITSTGVTLTTTQKTNANAVFVGLKTNISAKWNKIKGLYLFLGGTAAAHAINAKLPGTNNLVFSGTSVHNAQGWQPDGSSGYAETGISPSSLTAQRGLLSFSVSGYGSTNPGFTAGAIQGTNRFYAGSISSTELFDALYVTAEQAYTLGTAKSLGSFAFNRSADANYTIAIDGSVVVTRTATADTGTINNTVIIGATKNASNTPQYFESALYSMFTIGLNGLTNTEISELASLEENYRTSR